ncbi:hypothetical protein WMZ97_01740 [Lentibacillus sp. N15]|uniref:hypothetical protein n=1 Tax=Lentibacillus songyuanensis TaxID=3136161 RepID=UPI0031BAC0DD
MKTYRIWLILAAFLLAGFLAACATDDDASDKGTEEVKQEVKTGNEATGNDDDVVTINDKSFDNHDLAFYTLMRNIQAEIGRHFDQEKFDGKELEDRNAYWDDQIAYNENTNVQLQNLIEIYAMALLAKEKNYYNPPEELDKAVKELTESMEDIKGAQKLIDTYGEKNFRQHIHEYMDYSLLRDRVVDDLTKDIKQEHPDITDDELDYELANSYGELFQDQVDSLEVEMHVK